MKRTVIAGLGLGLMLSLAFFRSLPAKLAEPADDDLDQRFSRVVLPFLQTNCLSCHDAKGRKGDLDLGVYKAVDAVAKDLGQWEAVAEQVESGVMPPAKAKVQPKAEERRALVEWVASFRKREAARNAGDPGSIPPRRLSNAEYDATVRDLTGVNIRPTREFPVDPANEAGFDNSAESLAMSPSLVRKYLEAARAVADHLVLKPEGFAFASHPVVADTDRDKYATRRIIDFYKRQRIDLVDYFQAAWTFRHRETLGRPTATLDEIAAEASLSRVYLTTLWATLNDPIEPIGPVAALQALWRDAPAPGPDRRELPRASFERMRLFVLDLRAQLVPVVKNLGVRGMNGGSQPLVLWKDREFVKNRRRYAGGATKVKPQGLPDGSEAAKAMAVPQDPADLARFEASFAPFCSTFPDAFFISERARIYIDKEDKNNVGRLLSAGFHSMTGYFRDDAPLSELMLDEAGRRELDTLWREFHFMTGDPERQYSSFLWFDRTDSTFMRGAEFDFARAEDKAAASEEMIRRLAVVYRAKAERANGSAAALQAIDDFFVEINAQIRQVEADRRASEPTHLRALQAFAAKAYRRPLTAVETDGIVSFYKSLRADDGLSHEDAVRDSVVGVLMSPHFCYRVDLAEPGDGIRPLTPYSLANRLSYFLWSSGPDDELLSLAESRELARPEVLAAQARRMLQDDRARALATEFGGNWLDFRRFEEHNSVDRGRFPSFNDELRRSMFEEPVRFLLDVIQQDRSVLTLLDADHALVNPSLARHYGMPIPSGGPDQWARVEGARKYGRGGLPSMAVFLTRNSPGLRTSPVKRGYWVAKRLLGEDIPAPPANVPDLPVDEAKAERTLRQSLEIHRADKACAGCHERFDPIGLAFEGYGPIGERRTLDLGGKPVDTKASFPGGFEGEGVDGLRSYLNERRKANYVDNLCEKLLAYGLGRGLKPSDDATLAAMHARLDADGHRFGGLVEAIVTSPQFRNKRVDGPPSGGLTR
jgi:mono/diheme cytochrome c family protein